MEKYIFNNQEYELVNNSDCFNYNDVKEIVTDYFVSYDYILGDMAYNKIRLKGFYDEKNPKVKELNNIKKLDEYIQNYCAYGAKTFLLKKSDKTK